MFVLETDRSEMNKKMLRNGRDTFLVFMFYCIQKQFRNNKTLKRSKNIIILVLRYFYLHLQEP